MAQLVNAPSAKAGDLSSNPGTPRRESTNSFKLHYLGTVVCEHLPTLHIKEINRVTV